MADPATADAWPTEAEVESALRGLSAAQDAFEIIAMHVEYALYRSEPPTRPPTLSEVGLLRQLAYAKGCVMATEIKTRPLPTPAELWAIYGALQDGVGGVEELGIRVKAFAAASVEEGRDDRLTVPTFADIGALYVSACDIRSLGEELCKQADGIESELIQLDMFRSDHDPMHRSEVAA